MEPLSDSSPEDEDVFHFETEHLALRGNQCYGNLLRTIAVLQAQRILVHQQIGELEATRNAYLENPQLMLDKLRNNEPLVSDNYISTAMLPELPTLVARNETGDATNETPVETKTSSLTQPLEEVRDRSNGRSEYFNRLWTNEEQQRLEQLLIQYPPEEVEMRRFGKIAKALGNRTAQQVFSRVQKYFQKLHDAGMPVPGRIPKHRKPGLYKHKVNMRRSTFFPAHNISLQMPEDDCTLDEIRVLSPAADVTATPHIKKETKTETEPDNLVEDGLDAEANRKQDLRLMILTSIQVEKQQIDADGYQPDPLAPKCAECEEATVTRTPWRCNSCYCHLNLCGDCLASQLIEGRFEHLSHEIVVDQET